MKKIGIAAAILLSAATQTAFADNFSGAFVGGQIGQASATTTHNDLDGWYNDIKDMGTTDEALSYGVRGGFNWTQGELVYGVAAEYVVTDLRTVQEATPASPTYYVGSELDAVASIRGRVGLASDKLAVLASLGFAYADGENQMGDTDGSTETIRASTESAGYVIGLSAEYALNANAIVALDISRYTFDSSRSEVLDGGSPQGYLFEFQNDVSVIGVSYNYKF